MLKTLVLSPRYTPDSISLRNAAIELGWEVERLPSWRPPVHLASRDVVPYGEPLFAAVIADTLGLALMEPRLSWVTEIPFDWRKREIQLTNLAAAREVDHPAFIKPADDKCFQARVYKRGSELPTVDVVGATSPVLISEPVVWQDEFRCFVRRGQVTALSIYSRAGELVEPQDSTWPAATPETRDAMEFAQQVLQDVRVGFPPAGVLDVGVIQDRGWAVVEANAIWGSGIYGCDPASVLETLSISCVKKSALADEDRQWVLVRENTAAG